MSDIPVIRLTVESMRHQMLHYLQSQHVELERMVDEEITRTIQSGELERYITDEVKRALPDHIKNVVNRALFRVRFDDESMEAIATVAREAIVRALTRDA